MAYDFQKSLNRAVKVLGQDISLDDVASLRMEPIPRTCCCSHCWPNVWKDVNEHVSPQGPIEHEGSVLVKVDRERFVLEQHESGPEIMALVTASVALVTAVVSLIATVFACASKERKRPNRIKIVYRRLVSQEQHEETLVEIDIGSEPSNLELQIRESIDKAFSKKK